MTALQDAIGALEASVAKSQDDIGAIKLTAAAQALDIGTLKTASDASAKQIAALTAAVAALQQAGTPVPTPLSDMATIAAALGYPAARLKWNEQFAGTVLDASKWIPQIADGFGIWRKTVPAPMSAMDSGGFDAEYFDPAQVVVNNGLQLIAQRSLAYAGYSWKSGCICTHGKQTFASGLILVKMKQPDVSNGMWPGIWMLEGGGEIDIQEGGFLSNTVAPNNLATATWHPPSGSQVQKAADAGADLSAGYHIWGMDYQPGKSMTWTLDGKVINTITAGVPTGAFTLILDLTVAQGAASSWRTVASANTPSPSVSKVAGVQWYQ